MADGYWNRQPPLHPSAGMLKRHRSDYDLSPSRVPSVHELRKYVARDDDRGGPCAVKDTQTIGTAYDRFLKNAQLPSHTSGKVNDFGRVALGRAIGGGMPALPDTDPGAMGHSDAVAPDPAPNGRGMAFGGQLPREEMTRPGLATVPLPPDASNTIYVEGLPSNCTKREVAHIFRPFVGYKEIRIVSKESKLRGRDRVTLSFVDFIDPACAATALSALQGYKMDEDNPHSSCLRLQFSKHPGPRSGSGPLGRR